jgi:hypothetical protein
VQVVKDRVLAVKYNKDSDVRNEAYSYPTAESIEASRVKAVKLEESLNESRVNIVEVRDACEMRKREVDDAILQARDPEAKKQLGKEFLREKTAKAKKNLAAAQRELMAFEAKIKTLEKELVRSQHQRGREEEAFRKIEVNNLYGKPIPPCFDSNPVLQKQDNVVKKLTDEEEKALRALELQETLRKREQQNKSASDESLDETKKNLSAVMTKAIDKPEDKTTAVAPPTVPPPSAPAAPDGLNFYHGERREKTTKDSAADEAEGDR